MVNCSENIRTEVDKKDKFGYYIVIMNEKFLLSSEITCLSDKTDFPKKGCAVAVGNFDGIHLGHRALLLKLTEEAKRLDLPAVVFSFDPDDNPKSALLLADKSQKSKLLRKLGVDVLVSGRFSDFRDVTATDFAMGFLLGELGAKSIICGYDFRFGKGREGSVALLRELLLPEGVEVCVPQAVETDGTPVSSSLIRNLVSSGEVAKASALLGRYFSFSSRVCEGARLGRRLGFPTINQPYPQTMVKPRFGVYAVYIKLEGGIYSGVANFGVKPTVGGSEPICETHIFDYSGDCYGKTAEIYFVEFLREEEKFDSLEQLKEQIERDKIKALSVLL